VHLIVPDREDGHIWEGPNKKGSTVKKILSFNEKNINKVEKKNNEKYYDTLLSVDS
jgi:hypothetical protein